MSDAAEKVQDVVADAAAEVAQQAEGVEQFVRSLNKVKIQFGLLGTACGAAAGAMVAFAVAYRKAETKYSQIADEEIAEMREHYQAKLLAVQGEAQKADLEEIVTERGYVSNDDQKPPMAVTPPPQVVEAAAEAAEEAGVDPRKANPAVPERVKEPEIRNVFEDADAEAQVTDAWDHHAELRRRSPDIPYVVHVDEKDEFDYADLSLTYYEGDDVLCNERNEILSATERERVVGEGNLNRFGHGSNDPSVVFVRNDTLETLIEVVRSPGTYAEEVHGFEHTGYSRNLERMRQREREGLDDGG